MSQVYAIMSVGMMILAKLLSLPQCPFTTQQNGLQSESVGKVLNIHEFNPFSLQITHGSDLHVLHFCGFIINRFTAQPQWIKYIHCIEECTFSFKDKVSKQNCRAVLRLLP